VVKIVARAVEGITTTATPATKVAKVAKVEIGIEATGGRTTTIEVNGVKGVGMIIGGRITTRAEDEAGKDLQLDHLLAHSPLHHLLHRLAEGGRYLSLTSASS